MQTMGRGGVRTDDGEGEGHGLDRGRVDVVVDDVDKMPICDVLAFQVLLLKVTPRWSTISGI